jgi:hypothetical protein
VEPRPGVADPNDRAEEPDPSVDGTVEGIVGWLTSHPGLVVGEPRDTTVGGLPGVYLDVSLDPAWTQTCPFSQGEPVVPILIGNGTSSLHHVILTGIEERLDVLEWNGGNVVIEVGAEGQPLDAWLTAVSPVIDTLSFST